MPDSILDSLKSETLSAHEAVEARVDLMNRIKTLAGYRKLIEIFYGLYSPLETEVCRSGPNIENYLPDIQDRMRTAALEHDLSALGNTTPKRLPLATVPRLGFSVPEIRVFICT